MTRTRLGFLMLAALVVTTQTALAENPKINVQIFRPASHPGDRFITNSSQVAPDGQWSAGALFNYGKNGLIFVNKNEDAAPDQKRHEVVTDQGTLDIMGSYALLDWVDIGLALPLFLVNKGEHEGFVAVERNPDNTVKTPLTELPGFALGDLRLSLKGRILAREPGKDGIGVGIGLVLGLPTGNADAFVSDGFSAQPALLVDYAIGPVTIGANVGGRIRSKANLEFLEVGSGLVWGLGATYSVLPDQLDVIGELYGGNQFEDDFPNASQLEGIIGARYTLADLGLSFSAGGGSGFLKGYGNTKFRFFGGVAFSPPTSRDSDNDGILDDVDKCPDEAEDKDGYEDQDGCPDADNDGDGILDKDEECDNEAEDKDGFQDQDGCPDLDNDGDGVKDANDKCPGEAEDKDGFKDDDGCPDLDNDEDGVPDDKDKCPTEPETLNGVDDDDGCPDKSLAKVEGGKITIEDMIFFKSGKAKIIEWDPDVSSLSKKMKRKVKKYKKKGIKNSRLVLDAVAGVLKANPKIKKIEVQGHTDDKGSHKKNLKLSKARAEAVKEWLVNQGGVAADRLVAKGYGPDKPLVEITKKMKRKAKKAARAKNRRVEFVILD